MSAGICHFVIYSLGVCCCFYAICCDARASPTVNHRPIIGILAQRAEKELSPYGSTYIPASYVKYVESAGARVAPIFINQSDRYYENMFYSINGVLWPGGSLDDVLNTGFGRAGKQLYNLAKESNNKGDYFPILAICEGFELIVNIAAGKDILTDLKAEDVNLNVTLLPGYEKSKLLANAPKELLDDLRTKEVTYNHHGLSLTPTNFSKNVQLNSSFNIISTSVGESGAVFISTIEAKKYPFYGIQWHPEKQVFEWLLSIKPNHKYDSIWTAQYFANFFINEARKSNHHFHSSDEEASALIYNYPPLYTGNISPWEQSYIFQDI